jgi:hypothetical protein
MAPPVTGGLILSLDAALGVTMDGANGVSHWADQSGAGNHFQQLTEAERPLWVSVFPYHDFPCVLFDDKIMNCVNLNLLNNKPGVSFFAVMRINEANVDQAAILNIAQGDDSNPRFRASISDGGTTNNRFSIRCTRLDSETFVAKYDSRSVDLQDGDGYMFMASVNCLDRTAFTNLTKWTTAVNHTAVVRTAGNFQNSNSTQITIGKKADGAYPLNAYIIEMLLYDRNVSPAESSSIYEYFNEKYFRRTVTVGTGGDFATVSDAIENLDNASQYFRIVDNYTINAISDTVQTSNYDSQIWISQYAQVTIDINGNGHKVELNDSGIDFSLNSLPHPQVPSIYKFYDFVIEMTGPLERTALSVQPYSQGTDVYNIFIYSSNPANIKIGIFPGNTRSAGYYLSIRNCILYQLKTGITGNGFSTTGAGGTDQQYLENVTLFNCGFGSATNYIGYAVCLSADSVGLYTHFRNVAILRNDGVTGRDVKWNSDHQKFINCATSDATTFADRAAVQPAQITDCIDGIVAADQLGSVVFGDEKFLRPIYHAGVGLYNGGVAPVYSVNDYDNVRYHDPFPVGAFQYILVFYGELVPPQNRLALVPTDADAVNIVVIPFLDRPAFLEEMQLDGVVLLLRFVWNSTGSYWAMDVLDVNKDPILAGIKLVLGYDLIGRYRNPGLPGGGMFAIDPAGGLGPIAYGDFTGARGLQLVYMPRGGN